MKNKYLFLASIIYMSSLSTLTSCDFAVSISSSKHLEFILINNDTEYSVLSCTNNENEIKDGKIIIPNKYKGKKVTKIEDYAFKDNNEIKYIKIPNNINDVGLFAFSNCTNLKTIIFEENSSISSFQQGTFMECPSLEEVILPEKLESIDDTLFYNCNSLKRIKIPETVKTIKESAFASCNSLEAVYLPENIETIGDYAFEYCTNLKGITFYNTLKEIGKFAFQCSGLKSLEIPSSVKKIGEAAFYDCSSLSKLTFAENGNLTTIEDAAFSDCNYLMEVVIPNTVTSLGSSVFAGCLSLYDVTLPDTLDKIPDYAFANTRIYTINLPNTITSIGSYAFKNCEILNQIFLPEGVKTIGIEAFSNCKKLGIIKLPKSLVYVANSAFLNTKTANLLYDGTMEDWCNIKFINENSNPMVSCDYFSLLKDDSKYFADILIAIPNGVEKIKSYQFAFSPHFAIIIPNSVKVIESNSFINSKIDTIYFEGSEEEFNQISVDKKDLSSCSIYYYAPKNSIENSNHKYWDYNSDNEPSIW